MTPCKIYSNHVGTAAPGRPGRARLDKALSASTKVDLLRHVAHDQAQVFVGNQGPDSHMALDGQHHARRKFVRRLMTTAAIGAEPLLSLHTEIVIPTDRLHGAVGLRGTRRFLRSAP